MNGLSHEAQQMLQRICKVHAAQAFAAEKVESLRPAVLCRAELQLILKELYEAGMLEQRQKVWGEKLYQIPAGQLADIQKHFFPMVPQAVAEGPVALRLGAGSGLPGELFRALLFIAKEGLPLTAKGAVHKKNLNGLRAELSLREEHLQGLIHTAPPSEPLPVTVTVMMDLMLVLGLISRQSTAYQLDTDRLNAWFTLDEPQMNTILYNVILNRYGLQDPMRQHFRYCISSAGFLPEAWYSLADILTWMQSTGLAADAMDPGLEASCIAWLSCLAGFGWCELGDAKGTGWCFRWMTSKPLITQSGPIDAGCPGNYVEAREILNTRAIGPIRESAEPASLVIVQPDFEVLVPPEVPYNLRWILGGCAELLHTDGLWSFRLCRERLEQAAEQGWSPQSVISWLASHALGGLPAQVEMSMQQWAKGIGRTAFSEELLLSCSSEADGAIIAAHPRCKDSLTRIGPLHFIVKRDRVEQVRKELAAAGMAPPRGVGSAEHPPLPSPFHPDNQVRPRAKYGLPPFEPELGLLGNGPLLRLTPLSWSDPGEMMLHSEDKVPQMWMKEWRKYHDSTAQKIMELAVKWGLKVRLAIAEEEHDFIPERIIGAPWRVSGCLLKPGSLNEPAELAAGEWEEMKLIIPEKLRNSSSAGASGYGMIRKSTVSVEH